MADDMAVSSTDAAAIAPPDQGQPAPPSAAQPPAAIAASPAPMNDGPNHGTKSLEAPLGLSPSDIRFALLCGGLILLLLLAHWTKQAFFGARLVEIDRLPAKTYEFRLDINSATWVEWMQLEGVGEVLARRIVANRHEHGPFASIDDVRRVPGVGQKTLESLRPQLYCPDCPRAGNAP